MTVEEQRDRLAEWMNSSLLALVYAQEPADAEGFTVELMRLWNTYTAEAHVIEAAQARPDLEAEPVPYRPSRRLRELARRRPEIAWLVGLPPDERAFHGSDQHRTLLREWFPNVRGEEWATLFASPNP